jgi:hypothetical protein
MKMWSVLSLAAVGIGVAIWAAHAQAGGCCMGDSVAAAPAPHHDPAASAPASGPASKPAIANTRCPIMGGKLDPANVPSTLTRQYKSQTIGFCCGSCPSAWDKLSDAEKDKKLEASK